MSSSSAFSYQNKCTLRSKLGDRSTKISIHMDEPFENPKSQGIKGVLSSPSVVSLEKQVKKVPDKVQQITNIKDQKKNFLEQNHQRLLMRNKLNQNASASTKDIQTDSKSRSYLQFTKQLQKHFVISFTKNNRVNQFRLFKLDFQPKVKFLKSDLTVIKAHNNDNDFSTDEDEYKASKQANLKDLMGVIKERKAQKNN